MKTSLLLTAALVLGSQMLWAAPKPGERTVSVELNKRIEADRTTLKEYLKNATTGKPTNEQASMKVDSLMKEMKISDLTISNKLKILFSDKLEAKLLTIVAAKRVASTLTDKSEAQSLDNASQAVLKLLAIEGNLAFGPKSENTDAAAKLSEMSPNILTNFKQAERNTYTEIINKYLEISESIGAKYKGKDIASAGDALIKAVMEVKNVDEATAKDLIKKLKDCV
ncbi:MAG: hypothetical protein ACOYOK_03075 [Pseudobdellovibrionaceae bacterium]